MSDLKRGTEWVRFKHVQLGWRIWLHNILTSGYYALSGLAVHCDAFFHIRAWLRITQELK